MSPNARLARTTSLENMLSISSDALVSMASQLSEAEQREHSSSGHRRWNLLQSMGDAKKLLQYMFNVTTDARKLFELLSLSTALAELTWPVILNKRHMCREVFQDFDPISISKLNEKKITTPGNSASSLLSDERSH